MVIFERLAQLLMPADGASAARTVEASQSWELDDSSFAGLDAAVWGRAPLLSGTARPTAARAAFRRERSLVKLRKGVASGLRSVGVNRWPPPSLGSSRPRRAVKNALLSGALVELSIGSEFTRVLDAASDAAGFPPRVEDFQPGSGGSVRITSDDLPGELLRVGAAETPVDPANAADALASLEEAGLTVVPRLIRRGRHSGASWSVETVRPGVTPERLTPNLLSEVVAFCMRLAFKPGPPAALDEDLEKIGRILPGKAEPIRELAEQARGPGSQLPSVPRHGDLWTGNLLMGAKGEFTGVLDWDAWHPAGVPGTDLLHLYAFDRARRQGRGLGDSWIRRPWRDGEFVSATEPYWKTLGVPPSEGTLDAVGIAWWLNQVAKSLERLPHLASHCAWVATNVDTVINRGVSQH